MLRSVVPGAASGQGAANEPWRKSGICLASHLARIQPALQGSVAAFTVYGLVVLSSLPRADGHKDL